MPYFVGKVVNGSPTDVHDSALNTVGDSVKDNLGNEYVYLQGVASTVAGDFVAYDGSGVTARLVTSTAATGPVAVAQAAVVANKYGWYLINGRYATANVATHSSGANKALFISGTAGRATSTALTEGCIVGAFTDGNSASNVGPVVVKSPVATGDIST